uniref:Uncharacterized protein n=1 Tax=Picea glauca TaxID=3330 RepID=A0A101M4E7_PICGL|nr:hypothetical protein ABT39_MTgene546 [Picea glauca]QHR89399.1 hypothetical protein Q903MT_gene3420 [Picea sitchensis]
MIESRSYTRDYLRPTIYIYCLLLSLRCLELRFVDLVVSPLIDLYFRFLSFLPLSYPSLSRRSSMHRYYIRNMN